MKKLLELRQQKSELIKQSKALLSKAEQEQRSLNGEEAKQAKAINNQINDINTHIELAEATAEEERSLISGKQSKPNVPTKQELRSFINASENEQRSLSIGVAADAGHTVIPHIDTQVRDQLRDSVVMVANAKNVTISTQEHKEMIGVGGSTTSWAGESDTRNETNTSKIEPISIKVGNLYAYPQATNEVLDHADFNLESWLVSEIGTEFSLALETACWNGDGNNKPKGLLTYTRSASNDDTRSFGEVQELTTATSAKTDFDDLITLVHSLKPSYRAGAKFYMSDSMAEKLRKIKNNQGDYIWRDAVTEGQPDMLLGKPVVITDEIPADEVLFSNMSLAYIVVMHSRGNVILRDQLTKPGFTKLHVNNYFGGGLRDSLAVKVLKEAA